MSYYYITRSPDYLEHHGILGMKWGVRRYQNKDGSLTPEGRARYGDVLTKKQMKNYIRDYNLVTGSDKKINKKTVFKTEHGLYDYKGRKIKNTNVEVENPAEEKKTEAKPNKETRMTDDELRAANERMRLEIDYRQKMAQLNPQKVSIGRQFTENLKNDLLRDIPAGISGLLKNAIAAAGNSSQQKPPEKPKKTDLSQDPTKANDEELKAMLSRKQNENKFANLMKESSDKPVADINSFTEDDLDKLAELLKDKV